jgi:hypothetical protein
MNEYKETETHNLIKQSNLKVGTLFTLGQKRVKILFLVSSPKKDRVGM